ncbi:choice-of-anchor D domain-containing protein [Candidatus Viridilinea mediisalina]|uniref:Peptidase S8/S53 domain-containing protein n=1 Tax=Candidatus Viridilinea mediisalina TaxID=2024553 RepID=A0A2A6RHW7_9CHLR|nr:choice-of-anchor D domain-containing protein [Candidatus Viridilinea mediisalina]PDW02486.1 hypothetical protein CJ255_13650 [Candidatus Viridilinea mediisalina]
MQTIRYQLRPLLLLSLFTLLLLHSMTAQGAPAEQTPVAHGVTDRLIVQWHEDAGGGAQLAGALAAVAGVDLSYIRAFSEDTHIFGLHELRPHDEVELLAQRLREIPEVLLAEPDTLLFPAFEPNDPLYASAGWPLWAVEAESYGIELAGAWEVTKGDPSIVIAIVDTGALLTHEDLVGRHLASNPGYDLISDPARSGDGSGRDPDPSDLGDFVTSEETQSGQPLAGCAVSNSSWHGAHVAGIIGATANNGIGIAGINQRSPLLHVRVLGKCGGYISDIADGVRWAVGVNVHGLPLNPNPARVINMSLGGGGRCNRFLQEAIHEANRRGAVVVAAAGNENTSANNFQPANCAGTITVAAVARTGWRARYSNYGNFVALAAPGGDRSVDTLIASTINSGRTVPTSDSYGAYQGTSMAAPHVAGVVSLMLSVNPNLRTAEIMEILQQTATPFPLGSSCLDICGAGIVNARAAVREAEWRRYGTIALANLEPSSLDFGGQAVGSRSAAQLVTLRNDGWMPLIVSDLSFPATFSRHGGSCPSQLPFSLERDAQCSLGIVFSPTREGRHQGELLLTSNSVDNPVTVALRGTGQIAAASFSPDILSFGLQQVGTQSQPQQLMLTSSGTAPLELTEIVIEGDFVRTGGTCPTSFPANLAAGQQCSLELRFAPSTATRTRGLLSLNSNALLPPDAVMLFGGGSAPALGFAPLRLAFGSQRVGTSSPAQVLMLRNPGSAPLTIEELQLDGDFERVGGSCPDFLPAQLEPLARCDLWLRFRPRSGGAHEGSLRVMSDIPDGPYRVPLSGLGLASALTLAPSAIHFGGQELDQQSLTQTLRLSSSGELPLRIDALRLDHTAFERTGGSCPAEAALPATLEVGSDCTLDLRFSPTMTGSQRALLQISTNAPDSPSLVELSGVGTTTPTMSLQVEPHVLDFVARSDQTADLSQTLVISNVGLVPILLTDIELEGAAFELDTGACGPLPAQLDVAATCTITVSLSSNQPGNYQGLITIMSDEPEGPRNVVLSSTLRALQPGVLNLGNASISSDPRWITLNFDVVRSGGSEGHLMAYYSITGERQPDEGDLIVTMAPINLAAGETQQRIEVRLNQLSLIAVRDLVITLEGAQGIVAAQHRPLRIAMPRQGYEIFVPLIIR